MFRRGILISVLCLASSSANLFAAQHVWTGAVSGVWSDAGNWGAGGPPADGESDVVLIFPAGVPFRVMANDVTVQNINRIEFRETAFTYNLGGGTLPMSGVIDTSAGAEVYSTTPILLLSDLSVSTSSKSVWVGGAVTGPFGITKTGPAHPGGGLSLAGANQYTGVTTVLSGNLEVAHAQGLGVGDGLPESGTVLAPGTQIFLADVSVANETLSVGGGVGPDPMQAALKAACQRPSRCVWGGPITLTSDTMISVIGTFLVDGPIQGPFRLHTRPFTEGSLVQFGGVNTFSGPTFLYGPSRIDVLASTSSVFVVDDKPYDNLSLDFRLRVAPEAVIGGFVAVSPLGVSPPAELGVAGPVAGTAEITNGLALGGTLSKLSIRIQSDLIADRFDVSGTVRIYGATLGLDSSAFDPAPGSRYVIVENDGDDAIEGTFAGLPEGAIFTANGLNYRISYIGGGGKHLRIRGNDITLTRVVGTRAELQKFSAE